jgi:hypothetical protein
VKLWTSLAEDEKIEQIEQREEKLNIAAQDLKNRHKTMSISLILRVVGDEKLARRSKGRTRGETSTTCSVGAPTRTSRTNDNIIGNRESHHGTSTLRKHTSVEGACYSAVRGDPHIEEHADEGKRR